MQIGFQNTGLLPGDIIFTWSDSEISTLIKIGSTHEGEPPTLVSHNALVTTPDKIIEAVARGTTYNPVSSLGEAVALRIPNLSEHDAIRMILKASRYKGKPYPKVKVFFLHALDWLNGGGYKYRRFAVTDNPYCTSLIILAGRAAVNPMAHFPFDEEEVQPDDLADFMSKTVVNGEAYPLVWSSTVSAYQEWMKHYPWTRVQ